MRKDPIRRLDILFAATGLLLLLPAFALIGICIKLSSRGPVFFIQSRVGLRGRDFNLVKFRTMRQRTAHHSPLTIGLADSRITGVGGFLRRFKLDELPQLWNVLKGEMSLVGPRPELRRYVNMYTAEQAQVLQARPGITDAASIRFRDEASLLALAPDPEQHYIRHIMPAKIELNRHYIQNRSAALYFRMIFRTLLALFKS